MMRFLKRMLLRWRLRHYPVDSLREAYYFTLKSARRCAHDLEHATNSLGFDSWQYEEFAHRAEHWLELFSPSGMKNYRQEVFDQMDGLEHEVKSLRLELTEAGIEPKTAETRLF